MGRAAPARLHRRLWRRFLIRRDWLGRPQSAAPRKPSLPVSQLALLCLLLLGYWGVSLHNITVVPAVHEDEPWQASTGWKLAAEGVFGSDLFAGAYNMERRYYNFLPAFPLLLAVTFRELGVGVFQSRLTTVCLGLMILVLSFSLARRLFKDGSIGLLAVLLLLTARLNGVTSSLISGILVLDVARIARYDILVPVFGLAALHAYISARQGRGRLFYGLAGALAGAAGLAHIYGVFWLPVLLLLVLWDSRGAGTGGNAAADGRPSAWRPAAGSLLFGFTVIWIPYLAYVLGGLADWRGQMEWYGGRFDLLNLSWYLQNVRDEFHRYGPGLGPLRPEVLLRIGWWTAVVAVPLSIAGLAWRCRRHGGWPERVVLVPVLVFAVLFALLIRPKLANYAIAFTPVAAIAVAWGVRSLWYWLALKPRLRRPGQLILAIMLLAVMVEGGGRVLALEAAANVTTPYATYIQMVRSHIPPGSKVLAQHNYWYGLEDHSYLSWLVPLMWVHDKGPDRLTMDQALDRAAPDIVLFDRRMRSHFLQLERAGDHAPALYREWLSTNGASLIAVVDDPTYGKMEIYQVKR